MEKILGKLEYNGFEYIITFNGDKYISYNLDSLKLDRSRIPNIDLETLLNNIENKILKNIESGVYVTKEEMFKDFIDLSNHIDGFSIKDIDLRKVFNNNSIVDNSIKKIFKKYDQKHGNKLDITRITKFIDGEKTKIKYITPEGKIIIFEDLNNEFYEKFVDIENESIFRGNKYTFDEIMTILLKTITYKKLESNNNDSFKKEIIEKNGISASNDLSLVSNGTAIGNIKSKPNDIKFNQKEEKSVGGDEVYEQSQKSNLEYPVYEENIVTEYIKRKIENQTPNEDITTFLRVYLDELNLEQLEMILSSNNFKIEKELKDQLEIKLEIKKAEKISENQLKNNSKSRDKILVLKLPNKNGFNDKSAFVDSLLLSFIVGVISGGYVVILLMLLK